MGRHCCDAVEDWDPFTLTAPLSALNLGLLGPRRERRRRARQLIELARRRTLGLRARVLGREKSGQRKAMALRRGRLWDQQTMP